MKKSYLNEKKSSIVISIVSTKSNTGKTTLIEKLISMLKDRGYSVGALKHDAHKFDIDKKGKDSYRFSHAGADNVVIASSEKMAMIKILNEEPSIEDMLKLFEQDIVIMEGFKNNKYPKIEVHRKGVDDNLLCNNPIYHIDTFVAVASDEDLDIDIDVLDLNNIPSICDYIEKNIIKRG
ncbi:molybdopterin-guanine dinucleotide biosynthesis protein B [Tepidibacter aestuarii]|uniref:molybdopterin-guanine dinucleotide biosynthesis protein B n=1 Tax=Tepidibacter aestuarii TaxID=2925782 RepID=UPI0020C09F4B|nr:molybdopterin-guanine dinucleotide biosynthesis protein B [Tepidibacter aestuarii]CAH2214853.1 molybdopterin-guanine dinucleotide biosynthesis adapter protein [Tepidibacter aestuarii]